LVSVKCGKGIAEDWRAYPAIADCPVKPEQGRRHMAVSINPAILVTIPAAMGCSGASIALVLLDAVAYAN